MDLKMAKHFVEDVEGGVDKYIATQEGKGDKIAETLKKLDPHHRNLAYGILVILTLACTKYAKTHLETDMDTQKILSVHFQTIDKPGGMEALAKDTLEQNYTLGLDDEFRNKLDITLGEFQKRIIAGAVIVLHTADEILGLKSFRDKMDGLSKVLAFYVSSTELIEYHNKKK